MSTPCHLFRPGRGPFGYYLSASSSGISAAPALDNQTDRHTLEVRWD